MPVESHTPILAREADERIVRRTMIERRRRVLRSVAAVAFVSLVMIVLAAMNRDREAIDSCEQRMRHAVRMLQDNHKQWLKDPARFPLDIVRDRLGEAWNWSVFENTRFTEQAAYLSAVGVCCCERPHGRLFRPGLRRAIVYHVRDETYSVRTLTESEFAKQADALGLGGVLLFR
jgi:hypothetical protein